MYYFSLCTFYNTETAIQIGEFYKILMQDISIFAATLVS